jgi:transposase
MTNVILGIDVSKKELSIALLFEGSYKKCKITNDLKGFKELTNWLKAQGASQVKACMEATGSYGEMIADYLYEQDHQVHIVNPACIKAFAKSKLSRHKTDEVDALLIAEYASKNDLRDYKPKDPALKELRSLYRCSQNLKQQQTQVSNFLENEQCLPKSVQRIYKNLGIHIEKQIETITLTIDQVLSRRESLKQDCENLQSIPGIGKTTAIAILAEMPDISSLENARQLAAYAGLTPCHRTSGTSLRGKSFLSKMGSPSLRKALYFPAITAKNHNPLLKAFAQKLAKKGKHTMVIIGAIMRKLLHIVFGIIKHKTPFNPNLLQNVS